MTDSINDGEALEGAHTSSRLQIREDSLYSREEGYIEKDNGAIIFFRIYNHHSAIFRHHSSVSGRSLWGVLDTLELFAVREALLPCILRSTVRDHQRPSSPEWILLDPGGAHLLVQEVLWVVQQRSGIIFVSSLQYSFHLIQREDHLWLRKKV